MEIKLLKNNKLISTLESTVKQFLDNLQLDEVDKSSFKIISNKIYQLLMELKHVLNFQNTNIDEEKYNIPDEKFCSITNEAKLLNLIKLKMLKFDNEINNFTETEDIFNSLLIEYNNLFIEEKFKNIIYNRANQITKSVKSEKIQQNNCKNIQQSQELDLINDDFPSFFRCKFQSLTNNYNKSALELEFFNENYNLDSNIIIAENLLELQNNNKQNYSDTIGQQNPKTIEQPNNKSIQTLVYMEEEMCISNIVNKIILKEDKCINVQEENMQRIFLTDDKCINTEHQNLIDEFSIMKLNDNKYTNTKIKMQTDLFEEDFNFIIKSL